MHICSIICSWSRHKASLHADMEGGGKGSRDYCNIGLFDESSNRVRLHIRNKHVSFSSLICGFSSNMFGFSCLSHCIRPIRSTMWKETVDIWYIWEFWLVKHELWTRWSWTTAFFKWPYRNLRERSAKSGTMASATCSSLATMKAIEGNSSRFPCRMWFITL